MAKRATDELCRENYQKLRALFDSAVADSGRFQMAYACGMDVGMVNFVVVRKTTYTYASYALGWDEAANEIVVLPVDVEMTQYGVPFYLKKADIDKAKMSKLSKEITIRAKSLPQKYVQFSVPEQINQDPDDVVILVKQDEEARRFGDFFKNSYSR